MALALSGQKGRLHPETDFQEDDVMSLALSQPTLAEGASPPFEAGRKLGAVAMALVWQVLQEDPECPSRVVLDTVAQRQVPMAVSARHLNPVRGEGRMNKRR